MKATLRLPDALAEELRARSRQEQRSINAIAVDALWRGLGRTPEADEPASVLGSFVSQPARGKLDIARLRRRVAEIESADAGLIDALEWARGDR